MRKLTSMLLVSHILIGGIGTVNGHEVSQVAQTSLLDFLNGSWEGTYVCRQGLTNLKLVITAKDANNIEGVFNFSAHPSNPSVPSGSFRMKGSYRSSPSPGAPASLELKGTTWITQPSNWVTVDLRGDVRASERKITGRVITPGCSSFELVAQKKYTDLEPTPVRNSLNPVLKSPPPSYVKSVLGLPGELSDNCSPVTNSNLKKLMVTASVGPFRVTGLRPAVSAIRRVFDQVKTDKPDLYQQLGTEGMLCVRKVRGRSDFSNHSWGTAIDIKINNQLDARGDQKTQVGLKELYPYFQAEGFYWGAAFSTEDSMHFEASQQLLEEWKSSGEIP
jgi:D-alanyl-D-alanine carboxypeptidase